MSGRTSNTSHAARPQNSLETPNGQAAKMSTPPHTTYSKRQRLPHITPSRVSDAESRTLLLSPAFSSPQPPAVLENIPSSGTSLLPPTQPIPMAMTMVDTIFSSHPIYNSHSAGENIFDGGHIKKKQKKARREVQEVGFLLDSSEKPPYSYATLIGMAILSHPDKQLTLSQIYLWISDTFKFYSQGDLGWQNLIRHNLSLNKAFVKGEKSKDGKGHFWVVHKESTGIFLKAKNNKRSLFDEVMEQLALQKGNSILPQSPNTLDDEESATEGSHFKVNNHTIINKNYQPDGKTRNDRNGRSNPSWNSCSGNQNPSNSHKSARRASVSSTEENYYATSDDNTRHVFRTPRQNQDEKELPERPILAGKNSPFTLSFSCSLNFDFLPVPLSVTGPLLEPLTPGRGTLRPYTSSDVNTMSTISSSKGVHTLETSLVSPILASSRDRFVPKLDSMDNDLGHSTGKDMRASSAPFAGITKQVRALSSGFSSQGHHEHGQASLSLSFSDGSISSTNSGNSIVTTHSLATTASTGTNPASAFLNLATGMSSAGPFSTTTPKFGSSRTPKLSIKTPLRILKTPLSGTVVRRLWQSPSYLEDFYHSPFNNDRAFLRLYDDDDMILRLFDSPGSRGKLRPSMLVQLEKLQTTEKVEVGLSLSQTKSNINESHN